MTPFDRGLQLARTLILESENHDAAPGDAFTRAERGFARLDAELSRWFGNEGYGLMIARAMGFSRGLHPLLERPRGKVKMETPLTHLAKQLRDEHAEEAVAALVQLFATFIALLERLVGAELATKMITQTWWNDADSAPPLNELRTPL